MNKTTKIKVIGNVNSELSENILNGVKSINGIESVELSKDFSLISYQILEQASDYDVMVAILNVVNDFGLDAEPLFDDELEDAIKLAPSTFISNSENENHHEHGCNCGCEHKHEHEHEHEHECKCGHEHHH